MICSELSLCGAGGTDLAQKQERMTQSGTSNQKVLMNWDGGGGDGGEGGGTARILAATQRLFFLRKVK